jgi:hypothetical protein
MKAITVILAAILLQQTGCDQPATAPKPATPAAPATPDRTNYQRFVPIPPETGLTGVPWSGDVALDTMTGQLCKTHEKDIKGLEIPLCNHLYLNTVDDPVVKQLLQELNHLPPSH